MGFAALGIDAHYVKKLREINIEEPTDVQKEAIPMMLAGRDLIAQSQTGTGKTYAYVLPILQRIDAEAKHVQAVIIVPTRELAMQIIGDVQHVMAGTSVRAAALIGGVALKRQVERLRQHPHLIVGTAGKILELINKRKLTMHYVQTIVIDEVDQVFQVGDAGDAESIIKRALRDVQIAFFSATIPESIMQVGQRLMDEPHTVMVGAEQRIAEHIEHTYYVCERRDKIDLLRRIVRHVEPAAAIVFVNGTKQIAELSSKLSYHRLTNDVLYGEASQSERADVLRRFRQGDIQLLIATDVAARGLDIDDVSHIINFDLPIDADHYIHRAGRTGRAGRSGAAISIITPNEVNRIERLGRQLHVTISPKKLYRGDIVSIDE